MVVYTCTLTLYLFQQERKNETLVHSIEELQRKVGWSSVFPSVPTPFPVIKEARRENHYRGTQMSRKPELGRAGGGRGEELLLLYSPEAELFDLNAINSPWKHQVRAAGGIAKVFSDPMGSSFYHRIWIPTDTLLK